QPSRSRQSHRICRNISVSRSRSPTVNVVVDIPVASPVIAWPQSHPGSSHVIGRRTISPSMVYEKSPYSAPARVATNSLIPTPFRITFPPRRIPRTRRRSRGSMDPGGGALYGSGHPPGAHGVLFQTPQHGRELRHLDVSVAILRWGADPSQFGAVPPEQIASDRQWRLDERRSSVTEHGEGGIGERLVADLMHQDLVACRHRHEGAVARSGIQVAVDGQDSGRGPPSTADRQVLDAVSHREPLTFGRLVPKRTAPRSIPDPMGRDVPALHHFG